MSWVRGISSFTAAPGPECLVQPAGSSAGAATTLALVDSSIGATATRLPMNTALSLEAVQLQHASTINAVGLRRELPDRARVIALATALQESSLRNRPDGDRDSLGLFQQRPSQGWGTVAEISDPVYASGKFYDALVEVPDWPSLSLTEAAQAVQYSAFPDAYAKWEPAAERLVSALSTAELGLVTCRADAVAPTADTPERPALDGLSGASPGLATLLAQAEAEMGGLTATQVAADGRTATAQVAVGSLDASRSAAVLATWTVAHATGAGVSHVIVTDRLWFDHAWGALGQTALPGGQVRVTLAG
ncbi:MAG: heavy metal transporter [Nakamurella sp.]